MYKKTMKSFGYAITGLGLAWKNELNFKIEIVCSALVLLLAGIFHLSFVEFAILILTLGMVLTLEIINSVCEEICDKFHPDHDPHIGRIKDLSAAAVFLACIISFIIGAVIFGSHMLNTVNTFDIWTENALYQARNPFALGIFHAITYLGDAYVVAAIGAFAIGILWLAKRKRDSLALFLTLAGTAASIDIVKILVERARPLGLIPYLQESTFSFPSGHAGAAMALYGFFIYLFCKIVRGRAFSIQTRNFLQGLIACLGSIIILLVGFSRLYLGVHFPSDIIAGYSIAGIWILIGIGLTADTKKI